MTLPATLKDLIDKQEALEAKRTQVLLILESTRRSVELEDDVLLCLQGILGHQMHVARQLLDECAEITCERIEWPHEIRA